MIDGSQSELVACLTRQLDIAWSLAKYHLATLTTEECLWKPASSGLHVRLQSDGHWHADWPETEGYDLGPASIAWLTWHLDFWWSMVFDHTFGERRLTREQVAWPGTAEAVKQRLNELHDRWQAAVEVLSDEDLRSGKRTRWPIEQGPLADVIAWANLELMKNVAEIGYVRFLYASRVPHGGSSPSGP